MNWRRLFLFSLAVCMLPTPSLYAVDDDAYVEGTIMSVRGNILVLRPLWRPKPKRVAIDDHTEITRYERVPRAALKPGLRVSLGGPYTPEAGLNAEWLEMAVSGAGSADKFVGLAINKEGTYANGGGTIKSIEPFVFVDDKGQELKANLTRLQGVWRRLRGDRNSLLIGTRVGVSGKNAPDDVVQATGIYPERGQAPVGTMFGRILGIKGHTIQLRPRFTTDSLTVTLKANSPILREVELAEGAIRIGQQVTFWGEARGHSEGMELATGDNPSDVKALALLVGPHRFPSATGEGAPRYWTGRLVALEPAVRLGLANGGMIRILPTAQMPIARLDVASTAAIRVGQDAMFVLSRRPDGSFEAATIILDASPWVGYGQ